VVSGGLELGKVAVSFKVMPADETVSLEDMEKRLREDIAREFTLGRSSIEELAFG